MQWKFSDLVNKELFSFPMFIKRRKTNFLQKSATKQLLAYRYGARKGNLTFFQNYSLNRGFHSLYGVKEDFRNLQQNKVFIPYMEWKLRKSKLFLRNMTEIHD